MRKKLALFALSAMILFSGAMASGCHKGHNKKIRQIGAKLLFQKAKFGLRALR